MLFSISKFNNQSPKFEAQADKMHLSQMGKI